MKTMTQSSPRVAIEPYKVYRDAFLRGPAGVRFKVSRKCIGKFTISRVGPRSWMVRALAGIGATQSGKTECPLPFVLSSVEGWAGRRS